MPRAITTVLRRSSVAASRADISNTPLLVGVCSAGPVNAPATIASLSDLEQFGSGELVEAAAAVLAKAGAPVFVCRAASSTRGANGPVTKTAGSVAPTVLYGGLLLPGADANGEVFVTAKHSGVSIRLVKPNAANQALATTIVQNTDGTVLISVSLATDGMAGIATTATQLAAELNANASSHLNNATAQGTGASLVSTLAETRIENGDLAYTPRRDGVTVAHVASGNNTALSVTVAGLAVTVNLATDANGTPTSTASQVAAAVAASAAAGPLLSVSAGGTGAGVAGVWGATGLVYGGTGALAVSGEPNDSYRVRVQVTREGTVGVVPYPVVRWSADDGRSWSGEVVVQASGAVSLNDSVVDTGLDVTLSGKLTLGTEWQWECTGPSADSTSMLSALQAALDNADNVERGWGFVAVLGEWGRSVVATVDGKIQAALQSLRKPYCLTQARGIASGGGPPDESEGEWRASVEADFAGLVSDRGLVSVCAGHFEHVSARNGWQYKRPLVLAAAVKRAGIPLHMNLGYTSGAGQIENLGSTYGELLHKGSTQDAGLRFYARQDGVSIGLVVSGNNTPFALAVSGRSVTVTCATDGTGNCLTTASQVAGAINGTPASAALLRAVATGTGGAVVSALPQKVLRSLPISHDERTQEGLGSRFITSRTYQERPGAVYFSGAPTLRDPSEADYDSVERVATVLAAARVAHEALFDEIRSTPPTIPSRESPTVPAGAISASYATRIEARIGKLIRNLLERPKADGEPSASPYGDIKPIEVLRNYSLRETNELRAQVNVVHLGRVDTITISAGGAIGE